MMKIKLVHYLDKLISKDDRKTIARKFNGSILSKIVAVIFFLGIIAFLVRWFMTATWGDILGYLVFMAVMLFVSFLMIVSRRAERVLTTVFNYNLLFLVWMLIILMPILFFRLLSNFIVDKPKNFQVPAFILWGLLLAFGSLAVFTEKRRERVLAWLQEKVGNFAPCAYALNLLLIAWMFFSSLTYVLVSHRVVSLQEPPSANQLEHPQPVSADSVREFYAWHFLQAVPLLKINDTLHWQTPLTYKSGLVGCLLLLFQLTVILPVIRAFAWWGKNKQRLQIQRQTLSAPPFYYF